MANLVMLKLYLLVLIGPKADKGDGPRDVKPDFNFPGVDVIEKLFGGFLVFIFFAMAMIFFACAASLAGSFLSKKGEGQGRAAAGLVVSSIVGGLALAGSNVFLGWSDYFS